MTEATSNIFELQGCMLYSPKFAILGVFLAGLTHIDLCVV